MPQCCTTLLKKMTFLSCFSGQCFSFAITIYDLSWCRGAIDYFIIFYDFRSTTRATYSLDASPPSSQLLSLASLAQLQIERKCEKGMELTWLIEHFTYSPVWKPFVEKKLWHYLERSLAVEPNFSEGLHSHSRAFGGFKNVSLTAKLSIFGFFLVWFSRKPLNVDVCLQISDSESKEC